MEDSNSTNVGSPITMQVDDNKGGTLKSLIIPERDSMFNIGVSDAISDVRHKQNNVPLVYTSTSAKAGEIVQLKKALETSKEEKIDLEEQSDFRCHIEPIYLGASFTSADGSSDFTVFKKVTDSEVNLEQSASLEDTEGYSSKVGKSEPPLIMKKGTSVKIARSKFKKSAIAPTLVSVGKSKSSINRIKSSESIKSYPPISVRKMSLSNDTCTNFERVPFKQKDILLKKLHSQHSAQCIKQGLNKCDFVCSLYRSNTWTEKDLLASNENVNVRAKKKSSSLVCKKADSKNNISCKGDSTSEKDSMCVCCFCDGMLEYQRMTHLKLDVPLPSSFLNPSALLRYYGIILPSSFHDVNLKKNIPVVKICPSCYDLILDGDALYQKLLSLSNQMKQTWHKESIVKDAIQMISDAQNMQNDTHTQLNEVRVAHQSESIICATKGTRTIHGRKLPFILPRTLTRESDSSLNDSDSQKCKLTLGERLKSETAKPKKIRSKPLPCGLCGDEFYAEDQWEQHLENHHKVQQKWLRFTPNMHSKLRTHIINELTKISDPKETPTAKCSDSITHTCYACDNVFNEKNDFVLHLRQHHHMVVDDELLCGFDKGRHNKKESLELRSESNVINDVDQILGSVYVKTGLEYGTMKSEHKSLADTEDSPNEILNFDSYEPSAVTTGDALLTDAYCQDTGDTHSFKNFSRNSLDPEKISDQKIESTVYDENNITCLICHKKFIAKKDLENHLEATHLLSVVLKGDGSGGVLDYVLDGRDKNLVIEETVDKVTDSADWQSNNILNSPFLTESKQIKSEQAEGKTKVPQCLVYECEICGRRIMGKKLLRNHLKKIHNITMNLHDDDPHFYCKYCLFRTSSRAVLEEHRKEKHGKAKDVSQQQCETCGKIYSSAYIQEHVAVMHGSERNHSCKFCGMKFFDSRGVKSHIYFEHANKQWKCEKCHLEFKKYHQLRQHMIYVHSTKEFKCEKCPKVFKRKGDLTDHNKRMHDKVILTCNYCPKQYRNTHKFRNHLIAVHQVSKEDTYSNRYARHKRANNRLENLPEKMSEASRKVLRISEDNMIQSTGARPTIENREPEFQLVEVMDSTNNDLELDEVTVLIF